MFFYIFLGDHPGLLNLWNENDRSKETEEIRWKSFCGIVSKKLKFEEIINVPKDLVIPVLALYYLNHVSQNYNFLRSCRLDVN